MVFIEWLVWTLTLLILFMALREIVDDRIIVRIVTRFLSLFLVIALTVTYITDISKLHLIWFVPGIFSLCRTIAFLIVSKIIRKRRLKEMAAEILELSNLISEKEKNLTRVS